MQKKSELVYSYSWHLSKYDFYAEKMQEAVLGGSHYNSMKLSYFLTVQKSHFYSTYVLYLCMFISQWIGIVIIRFQLISFIGIDFKVVNSSYVIIDAI